MVIIRMRPTRCIHLTSRNTYRTKGCHRKGRLFTTTPVSRLHGSQRRAGACIGRCVDYLLVAPMVHVNDRLLQRKSLYAVFQFLVKYHTAFVEVFIVYPNRKHEMAENVFRYCLSPRHLLTSLKRCLHVLQEVIARIIGNIPQWHVGIEKLKSLLFSRAHGLVKHCKQIALSEVGLSGLQVCFNLRPVRFVCNKVRRLILAARPHEKDRQQ